MKKGAKNYKFCYADDIQGIHSSKFIFLPQLIKLCFRSIYSALHYPDTQGLPTDALSY